MTLTDRDKDLLLKIQSYGLFTTNQICDLFFKGVAKTTVLRRLRILKGAGYIQKLEGLKDFTLAWGLTKKSAEMFSSKPSKIHFSRHSLEHEAKLTTLRLYLEDQRILTSWIPEHEIRSRVARKHGLRHIHERVIPDGLASILRNKVQESVAIELELFPKNSSRYRQILRNYAGKTNLFAVWYVVSNASIGRQILKVKKNSYFGGQALVFWSTLVDVMKNGMSAKAHFINETFTLNDIWSTQDPSDLLAHTPALGVSSVTDQNIQSNHEISSSNKKEILAEVG